MSWKVTVTLAVGVLFIAASLTRREVEARRSREPTGAGGQPSCWRPDRNAQRRRRFRRNIGARRRGRPGLRAHLPGAHARTHSTRSSRVTPPLLGRGIRLADPFGWLYGTGKVTVTTGVVTVAVVPSGAVTVAVTIGVDTVAATV